ncbi:MAG: Hpt domain-containing protein, partial [Bdellovibrionia bacterium]
MYITSEEMNEFKTESLELINKAEESLIALDNGASLKAHYDTILRAFHNIKGSADIIASVKLQSEMHHLENLMIPYASQDSIPKQQLDLILKGLDAARLTIKEIFQQPPQKDNSETKPDKPAPRPAEPTPISDTALNEFLAECDEISQRLSVHFSQLEIESPSHEILDSVYRDIHSLKGSAHLFGFTHLGALGHAIESSLEPIRKNRTAIPGGVMNALYKSLDIIERMVNIIRNRSKSDPQAEFEVLAPTLAQLTASLSQSPEKPNHEASMTSAQGETHAEEILTSDAASTIRVSVTLLDKLMNLVGEMVLVRNQILQFSSKNDDLDFLNLSQRLNIVTGEIQEELMKTRMQPIGNIFNKFHRIMRGLTQELDKKINLNLSGTETEL